MRVPQRENSSSEIIFNEFIDRLFENRRIGAIDRNKFWSIVGLTVGPEGQGLGNGVGGFEGFPEEENIVEENGEEQK